MSYTGALRRQLFGISLDEVRFERRGFRTSDPDIRDRLELIAQTFVHGYHAALLECRPQALAETLNRVDSERRGFAFEGAAMALALLDVATPWKRDRLQGFLQGPGDPHAYMVHVGAGWAMARLPWGLERRLRRLDPLLRWRALDGYGFHEGFFHWPKSIARQQVPRRLSGYAARVFDQGLGRSLWFIKGTDVAVVAGTVGEFPQERQDDLWSGVGLAATYAGGVGQADLERPFRLAGPHWPALSQGAAFAAKARQRAGNATAHTALAAQVLCGCDADAAALLTDEALEGLPDDGAGGGTGL